MLILSSNQWLANLITVLIIWTYDIIFLKHSKAKAFYTEQILMDIAYSKYSHINDENRNSFLAKENSMLRFSWLYHPYLSE